MTKQNSRPEAGATMRGLWWIPVVDVIAVLVFSVLGRGAHNRTPGIAGVLETAWPFLLALAVAWIVRLLWKTGAAPISMSTAGYFWAVTLIGGMLIRGLSTGRIPHWSFMIVAAIALAVLLFGWRAIAGLIRRRTAR
jgi:hypothetical protein